MPGKNARKRAAQTVSGTELRSGMQGNGGRFAPVNGHPDIAPDRASRRMPRDIPYRVAGTTAGQGSTRNAHNTTVLYRNER